MKAKKAAKDFSVICVGGSAGGLDAYIRLLLYDYKKFANHTKNPPTSLGMGALRRGDLLARNPSPTE
jgi:hypothetical protein